MQDVAAWQPPRHARRPKRDRDRPFKTHDYSGHGSGGQSHEGVGDHEPRSEEKKGVSALSAMHEAAAAAVAQEERNADAVMSVEGKALAGTAAEDECGAGRAGFNPDFCDVEVCSVPPALASGADRRIVKALAAVEETHARLLRTASLIPEILQDPSEKCLVELVELYGSLSLDLPDRGHLRPARAWQQDWSSYYVTAHSDVDFVVEMKPGVSPAAVAQRLVEKGPWRLTNQVQVHKFGSTQYTLVGTIDKQLDDSDAKSCEVFLDITCIENHLHFERFKQRQEAFRRVFLDVRSRMEAQYAAQGALAFDAYIHLLKAFAAKVPGNALTGFQATCIGLFTLMNGHFRMKPMQSIAPCLFEGFLRFCIMFYQDTPRTQYHYRSLAIDLTGGGKFQPRMSSCWRSEIYFMAVEERMCTQMADRMNIAHSLEPSRVSIEAHALLTTTFCKHVDNWEQRPSIGAGPPVILPDAAMT